MEQISQKKATLFVIVAAFVCSVATFAVTATLVGERERKAGVEEGTGQLLEPKADEVYELKLVGVKGEKVYEIESSYGHSVGGVVTRWKLPFEAKAGDSVACIQPSEGIQIVSRRP